MGSIVTIHSYRGGTGKSNVSANTATAVAMLGKRVAVIDTDIQSPGIHVLFGFDASHAEHTLNDYLSGRCSIDACAYDVSGHVDIPGGKVFLLPASLQYMEIAKILKNGYDLERMTDGFREAIDKLRLDFLFVDTHPGLNEETMLFTVMSRLVIVLLRPDQQDYLGTGVVVEVARKLGVPRIGLVVNKLLASFNPEDVRARLGREYGCDVLETLPFDQGVMENASSGLMVLRHPDHPWSKAVERLARTVLDSAGG